MRLLVTGGAGFIGSHFIRHILSRYPDYSVVNLDSLAYSGNLENIRDLEKNPRYTFIQGDICDPQAIHTLARDLDAIVNFAALTHVDRSILEAGEFVRTDVFGTYVLVEAGRRFRLSRVLQVSTDEVYGSVESDSSQETDPVDPRSPYSASKAGGELIARAYFTTFGLPVIISRGANTFGPSQYPEKFIPLCITNAIDNHPLPIYGDGLYTRDWLYVVDHCEALDLLLHKGNPGEIYNIGAGNERYNIDVARLILKYVGKPLSLLRHVTDRPGHDRRYSLDWTKIRALGFQPRHPFEKALLDTVRWYRENEGWWRTIREGEEFQHYYTQMYTERLK